MHEPAVLAAKLRAEGDKLARFMAGLDDDDWKVEVYADGETWTVRSILAHLMTTERAFLRLLEQIRNGGPGVAEDFVIDRYNARQQEKTRALNWRDLLAQFQSLRAQMVAFVEGLDGNDLERRGRHPFLGMTSLREMLKMVYIHNQTHSRDIRRALGSR